MISIPGIPQLTLDLLVAALQPKPVLVKPTHGPLTLEVLYDYAHDNQFGKNGQYWQGRKPVSGSVVEILPQLVSDDQIGPAIEAVVSGQLDRDPEWSLQLDGKTVEAAEDGTQPAPLAELSDWHALSQLLSHVRDAARAYQWAGRMIGRVYIPDVYAELLQDKQGWTLADALALVHVSAVDPRQGGPLLDGHGRVLGYYYTYTLVDGATSKTKVELHTPDKVWTLESTAGNLQAVLPEGQQVPLNPYSLRGEAQARRPEFLMWHADRDGGSAITPSIRGKQDRLNAAVTNAGRNDDAAGFRQIVVANAEQPKDPQTGKDIPWSVGPSVAIRLVGLPYDDVEPTGGTMPRRHTPTWQVVDPVDPEKFQGSIDMWTRLILRGFDQEWRTDPQAAVSGESKRVSRRGHDKRVAFAAADTGAFLAWALRSALVLASSLMGEQALKEALTALIVPRLYLDVDSSNLAEYRELLAAWRDGGLDLLTLAEATPTVHDAATVVQRVREEWKERGGAPPLGSNSPPVTGGE